MLYTLTIALALFPPTAHPQPPARSAAAIEAAYNAGVAALERRDYAEARRLWEPLAQAGHAASQRRIGHLYDAGDGVARDPAVAAQWFAKAAAQGEANAKNALGRLYAMGSGVPRDYARAMALYKEAEALGFVGARLNIGLLHLLGLGVPANPAEAVRLIRLDAAAGLAHAQNQLAAMAEQGQGLARDPVLAYALFGLAHAKQMAGAGERQQKVGATLSGAQRREAEALQKALGAEATFGAVLDRRMTATAAASVASAASAPGSSSSPSSARTRSTLLSGEPPDAWRVLVAQFMDAQYGPFNPRWKCWPTTLKNERYCMSVVSHHWGTPAADGGPTRMYVLATGLPVDERGQVVSVNALPTLVGAFVADRQGHRMVAIAAEPRLPLGSAGNPPGEWQFIEIGPSLHGWLGVHGACQQGYCTRAVALLAPRERQVVNVGFPVAYSDVGACSDRQCEARASELEMTFETNERTGTPLHGLTVKVTGRLNGKPVGARPIAVPFDAGRYAYAFPKDPALARVLERP